MFAVRSSASASDRAATCGVPLSGRASLGYHGKQEERAIVPCLSGKNGYATAASKNTAAAEETERPHCPRTPPRNGTVWRIDFLPDRLAGAALKTCGGRAGFLFRPVAVVVGSATPPPPLQPPVRQPSERKKARALRGLQK